MSSNIPSSDSSVHGGRSGSSFKLNARADPFPYDNSGSGSQTESGRESDNGVWPARSDSQTDVQDESLEVTKGTSAWKIAPVPSRSSLWGGFKVNRWYPTPLAGSTRLPVPLSLVPDDAGSAYLTSWERFQGTDCSDIITDISQVSAIPALGHSKETFKERDISRAQIHGAGKILVRSCQATCCSQGSEIDDDDRYIEENMLKGTISPSSSSPSAEYVYPDMLHSYS